MALTADPEGQVSGKSGAQSHYSSSLDTQMTRLKYLRQQFKMKIMDADQLENLDREEKGFSLLRSAFLFAPFLGFFLSESVPANPIRRG